MEALNSLLIGIGPGLVLLVCALLIALLVAAVVMLGASRARSVRALEETSKSLVEQERRSEQFERKLKVLSDFTYVSDFRLDRIYTLLARDTVEVDGDRYDHGVVRDEQGRVAPFFAQQSLEHLAPGDVFSRVRNELTKLQRPSQFESAATGGGVSADATAPESTSGGVVPTARSPAGMSSSGESTMLFRPPLDPKELNKDPNTGQPYVKVIKGEDVDMLSYVPFTGLTIGRDPTNPVRLNDNSSSRVHCRVAYEGHNFVLLDNGSTNGTYYNGERVQRAVLSFGDVIGVGDSELLFSCQGYDLKDQDAVHAISVFEDCLEREPDYIAALRMLAFLLERDVARKREAAPLWDRVMDLEKSGG